MLIIREHFIPINFINLQWVNWAIDECGSDLPKINADQRVQHSLVEYYDYYSVLKQACFNYTWEVIK